MTSLMKGAALTMSSRELAELTGKQHHHVVRDIRAMLEALKDDPEMVHPLEDKDKRGYTAAFHLSRELTETLITGYSIPLRHKVIRRLHELEQKVAAPAIPQSLPEALRLAADLAERNSHLQLVVSEQAPKVEVFERIASAAGSMCMTDAAKHLGIKPSVLRAWLQENRWIFRRHGSARWLAYQPRLESGVLVHRITPLGLDDNGDERAATQVRITAKGLTVLAQRLSVAACGGA